MLTDIMTWSLWVSLAFDLGGLYIFFSFKHFFRIHKKLYPALLVGKKKARKTTENQKSKKIYAECVEFFKNAMQISYCVWKLLIT